MDRTTEVRDKGQIGSREKMTELLKAIDTKTVSELQELYNELEGKAITTRNKPFLIKKISAAIHEQLERIDQTEEVAPKNPEQKTSGAESPPPAPKSSRRRKRDSRLPPAGTILSREYKGERHEVLVLDDGFTYNGEHFGSLSKIAKQIAGGTSWNGYLFFKRSLSQASDKV